MADQKITNLNSLTNSTIDVLDVLPIVDVSAGETKKITAQNLLNPQDSTFAIVGSSDQTKKVQFEVDGLTTATTRTITIPDASTTMVGTDTTQTLTLKTLTSPKITAGSMSKGDLFQLSASDGTLTPLRASADGDIIQWSVATSQWQNIPNPSASNISATVKGVGQLAVAADITAGTGNGSTGAPLLIPASLVGTPAAYHLVQYDSAGKLPAVDGSQLTNVVSPVIYKNNVTTFSMTTASASGSLVIAHGIGKIPKYFRVTAMLLNSVPNTADRAQRSFGSYNGTSNMSIFEYGDIGNVTHGVSTDNTNIINIVDVASTTSQALAVSSWDATNVTLTNVKTGSPTGTMYILWEAEG